MARSKTKTKTKAKATKAKAKAKPKKTAKAAKPKKKPAKKTAKTAKKTAKTSKSATQVRHVPSTNGVSREVTADVETTPTSEQLAQLAKAGDLQLLFGLMDGSADSNRDVLAYKWLAVASDFGHEEADDMIGDLLEASSLRYDDDQFETGNAHWELGLAYLTGTEGLPKDLEKARAHLADAKERQYPMSVQESETMLVQARARLEPEALAVFDLVYDGSASPGVIDDREDEGDEDE
jgi:TPR repeat protein